MYNIYLVIDILSLHDHYIYPNLLSTQVSSTGCFRGEYI